MSSTELMAKADPARMMDKIRKGIILLIFSIKKSVQQCFNSERMKMLIRKFSYKSKCSGFYNKMRFKFLKHFKCKFYKLFHF